MGFLTAAPYPGTIFIDKYRELYTCVGYSADDMGRIRDEIDDKIRQEACCEDLFLVLLILGLL